jgi:photosystem II stability/assembly factor-like uncharacterized protein
VACPSAGTCYAVGWNGTILKTTDGATWVTLSSGTRQELIGVACPSASACFVVGGKGTILKTTDGATWVTQRSDNTYDLNGVACPSASTCYAVGNGPLGSGTILKTTDGATWATESYSPPGATPDPRSGESMYGVACPSASICYSSAAY